MCYTDYTHAPYFDYFTYFLAILYSLWLLNLLQNARKSGRVDSADPVGVSFVQKRENAAERV